MATEVLTTETDHSGRTVGNWRLVRPLGVGGFGAVYEAEHQTIPGRRGAVKVLHPQMALNADIKRRFLNEASAASRADHENIVQIFDGGVTDDGLCYVVMELLAGRSLAALLHDGPLSVPRTVNIARQVVAALGAAHGLGIVHRDLKPDNVFIISRDTNPEFVKVLDFGIAKLNDGTGKTQTGLWLGTPPYMAPEQWQTLPDIDGRADLYALGIILYQCLTGRLPFSATTPYGWLTAHLEHPVPEPIAADGPPELLGLVRRLLAKRREDRPQHAAEVLRELRRCGEPGAGAPPMTAADAAPGRAGARRAWVLPLVLGLPLVALLGGGLWWRGRSLPAGAVVPAQERGAEPAPVREAPPPPPVAEVARDLAADVVTPPPDLTAPVPALPEAAGSRRRPASKRGPARRTEPPPPASPGPAPAPPADMREPGESSGRRKHQPIY